MQKSSETTTQTTHTVFMNTLRRSCIGQCDLSSTLIIIGQFGNFHYQKKMKCLQAIQELRSCMGYRITGHVIYIYICKTSCLFLSHIGINTYNIYIQLMFRSLHHVDQKCCLKTGFINRLECTSVLVISGRCHQRTIKLMDYCTHL